MGDPVPGGSGGPGAGDCGVEFGAGGLWAPPEFASFAALLESLVPAEAAAARSGEPVPHAFTHFDLLIHPVWVGAAAVPAGVADAADGLWYNAARPAQVGLPAPIVQLLQDPP